MRLSVSLFCLYVLTREVLRAFSLSLLIIPRKRAAIAGDLNDIYLLQLVFHPVATRPYTSKQKAENSNIHMEKQ